MVTKVTINWTSGTPEEKAKLNDFCSDGELSREEIRALSEKEKKILEAHFTNINLDDDRSVISLDSWLNKMDETIIETNTAAATTTTPTSTTTPSVVTNPNNTMAATPTVTNPAPAQPEGQTATSTPDETQGLVATNPTQEQAQRTEQEATVVEQVYSDPKSASVLNNYEKVRNAVGGGIIGAALGLLATKTKPVRLIARLINPLTLAIGTGILAALGALYITKGLQEARQAEIESNLAERQQEQAEVTAATVTEGETPQTPVASGNPFAPQDPNNQNGQNPNATIELPTEEEGQNPTSNQEPATGIPKIESVIETPKVEVKKKETEEAEEAEEAEETEETENPEETPKAENPEDKEEK